MESRAGDPEPRPEVARLRRAEELFHGALEVPESQRDAFLRERCVGEPSLLAQVRELLCSDSKTEKLVEAAQWGLAGDRLMPGTVLGGYRILRLVATGGMGSVYLAAQEHPRREVALKLIRAGFATASARRRFQFEAEVLGRLRHPGIAQLHEAGTFHHDGAELPYFAMEYIPGARDIVGFCREQALPLRRRLELLAAVADAVDHGHRRGIIHRDLKPGNVLVDAEGHAKVIDFGVARSLVPDHDLTTMHTVQGQLLGTIHYMSPEQCAGDPDAADTRSDVYSLGVVLYELITGELPYGSPSSSLLEFARCVREQPPVAPRQRDRRLPAEVETILLKCLEKDPERRYGSAGALAEDLRRFLDHRPVLARRPSAIYQLRKLALRRPWATAGVIAVPLLLLLLAAVFIATLTSLRNTALRERDQAVQRTIPIKEAALAHRADDVQAALANLEKMPESQRGVAWQLVRGDIENSVAQIPPPLHCDRFFNTGTLIEGFDESGRLHVAQWRDVDSRMRTYTRAFSNLLGTEPREDLAREITGESPGWILPLEAPTPHGLAIAWEWFAGDDPRRRGGVDGQLYWARISAAAGSSPASRRWRALPGPVSFCSAAAPAPGGRVVALMVRRANDDYRLQLWDVVDGRAGSLRAAHTNWIRSLCFDRTGRFLLTCSADFTACLWRVDGLEAQLLARLDGHQYYVMCAAFLQDASDGSFSLVATGSQDQSVRLYDVSRVVGRESEEPVPFLDALRVIPALGSSVRCLATDRSGTRLYIGLNDSTIPVWDVLPDRESWQLGGPPRRPRRGIHCQRIGVLRGHRSSVWAIRALRAPESWPAGDEVVVSADSGSEIRLWPTEPFVPRPVLRAHLSAITGVHFGTDGKTLHSTGGDGRWISWDPARGVVRRWHEWRALDHPDAAIAVHSCLVAVERAGRVRDEVVILSDDGQLALLAADSGAVLAEATLPRGREVRGVRFVCVACGPSGGFPIFALSYASQLHTWDGEHPPRPLAPTREEARTAENSASGADERERPTFLATAPGQGALFVAFAVAPADRNRIEIRALDDPTRLLGELWVEGPVCSMSATDPLEGSWRAGYPGREGAPRHRRRGRDIPALLAVGGVQGSVRVFDLGDPARPREVESLEIETRKTIRGLAFTPDGSTLAVPSGPDVQLWDVESGALLANAATTRGNVGSLCFDPRGSRLAAGVAPDTGADNIIWLWETRSLWDDREQLAARIERARNRGLWRRAKARLYGPLTSEECDADIFSAGLEALDPAADRIAVRRFALRYGDLSTVRSWLDAIAANPSSSDTLQRRVRAWRQLCDELEPAAAAPGETPPASVQPASTHRGSEQGR